MGVLVTYGASRADFAAGPIEMRRKSPPQRIHVAIRERLVRVAGYAGAAVAYQEV